MYEIYINDRPLRLFSTATLKSYVPADDRELIARYTGKVKTLLHYADVLEKGSPKVSGISLHFNDLEQLWQDFRSHYKIVAAAGGVVNLKGTDTYLFIYRREHLDLPKGKIDPGETESEAALREVSEETGLDKVQLLTTNYRLPTTYHTYKTKKGKRVLKPTYWFAMETEQRALIPQEEEDIEWARWLTFLEARNGEHPIYRTLLPLLK